MESANKSLSRIKKVYFNLINFKECDNVNKNECLDDIRKYHSTFIDKMNDDFNTADAISVIFEFVKYVNKYITNFNSLELSESIKIFDSFFDIFGLTYKEIEEFKEIENDVKEMVKKRMQFKQKKQFDQADIIRDELVKRGYILEDINDGTRIKDINNNLIYIVLV